MTNDDWDRLHEQMCEAHEIFVTEGPGAAKLCLKRDEILKNFSSPLLRLARARGYNDYYSEDVRSLILVRISIIIDRGYFDPSQNIRFKTYMYRVLRQVFEEVNKEIYGWIRQPKSERNRIKELKKELEKAETEDQLKAIQEEIDNMSPSVLTGSGDDVANSSGEDLFSNVDAQTDNRDTPTCEHHEINRMLYSKIFQTNISPNPILAKEIALIASDIKRSSFIQSYNPMLMRKAALEKWKEYSNCYSAV